MKSIKYLIVLLLICIGILLPGEAYQNYIYDFSMEPKAIFLVPENVSADEMKNEILVAAKENNVSLYFVEEKVQNNYTMEINIYCDKDVQEYILSEYDVGAGERKSLFSGNCHIYFKDWNELNIDSMMDTPEGYYIVGDIQAIKEFEASVGNKYEGDIVLNSNANEKKEITICLFIAWSAIILVLATINYYEVVKSKKEMTVRMTMGDSMTRQAVKSMLVDSLVYTVIFLGISFLVYKYEGGLYLFGITILLFIIMLIISVGMSCFILFNDYKKSLGDIDVDKKVLGVSYVMKMIVTILLVVSLSGNFVDSIAYIETVSQQDLYAKYKDYSYVTIESADVMSGMVYASIFYEKYVESRDIVAYEQIISEDEYTVISANTNFAWYLEKHIESFSQVDDKYKKYAFIPIEYKGTDTEKKILRWDLYLSDDYGNREVKTVYYDEKLKLPVQDNNSTIYEYIDNPVIFYSSQNDFTELLSNGEQFLMQVRLNRYFVNVSDDEVEDIIKEAAQQGFDITVKLVDVYEKYQYNCLVLKRIFICNLAVTLMMLLIEILLIFSIIRMEYVANRKLLIIKKVLGYSLFLRYGKLYKNTLISGIISLLLVLVIGFVLKYKYNMIMFCLTALILFLEMMFITLLCAVNDKTNIQRTLKNGF